MAFASSSSTIMIVDALRPLAGYVAGNPLPPFLVSLAALLLLAAAAAAAGRRTPPLVLVDGVFDMVHCGHANCLRQAAAACGMPVACFISADADVVATKGAPPLTSAAHRAAVLAEVRWVARVRSGAPYSLTASFLDEVSADGVALVAHGDDACVGADGADAYAEARARGMMREVRRTAGVSSSALIGALLSGRAVPPSAPCGLIGEFAAAALRDTAARLGRSAVLPRGRDAVTAGCSAVVVEGEFEVVTEAHLSLLAAARRRADALGAPCLVVVAVRGEGRLLGAPERALMALSLRPVDEVVLGEVGGRACGRYPVVARLTLDRKEEAGEVRELARRAARDRRRYARRVERRGAVD